MSPLIAVLMTSYNRRAKTLACLTSLMRQDGLGTSFTLRVVLVDASSPDGTAGAVEDAFPEVDVVSVPSNVFWGGGMSQAAARAATLAADYHLWLNDDVVLDAGALLSLIEATRGDDVIAVGQLRADSGEATYGGMRRTQLPLRFVPIGISCVEEEVDTFNGNVVLVPARVVARLGGPDPRFPHAMGDIDYGLRAARSGIRVRQAPGSLGTCERNAPPASLRGGLRRVRRVASVKFLPPAAWWLFCRRHGRVLAPAYFIKPYLSALVGSNR